MPEPTPLLALTPVLEKTFPILVIIFEMAPTAECALGIASKLKNRIIMTKPNNDFFLLFFIFT
jgi:hypothetical protein